MARKRYQFDEPKVRRYIAEGRGQGDNESYRPWLKVYDLASRGRSHRLFGIKTGRVHHLLSDGEWKSFLRYEFDPSVLDIREQFPLDRYQTMKAARDLGFKHPVTIDGTPYVLTIDFLITRLLGEKLVTEALSFKYSPESLTERAWQLHAISAECVRRQGLTLKMIDETSFDENFIRNYDSIRGYFDISPLRGYSTRCTLRVARCLVSAVSAALPVSLEETCYEISRDLDVSPNEVLTVAKHLLARDLMVFDLGAYDDLTLVPMGDIQLRREHLPCQ